MSLDLLMRQLQENTAQIEDRRREANARLQQAAAQFAMQGARAAAAKRSGGRGRGGRNVGGAADFNVGSGKPSGNLKTVNFRGMRYTVDARYAKNFQGFLRALAKRGYVPSSIGGYADRNIAGTNTKSLHSYGLAIDIDPGKNPVTWNGKNITALPKGTGKLASKFGLVWGGNWSGSKRDPMHFSVPYKGLK